MEQGKKLKFSFKNLGLDKLVILLLAGIFLLIISSIPKKTNTPYVEQNPVIQEANSEREDEYITKLEEKLKKVLSKVEGVGKTEVMITLKSSKELVVNKDQPYSNSTTEEKDAEGGTRTSSENSYEETTVLSSSAEGLNRPFVLKEIEPEINGIVIIAEGGENPIIKSNLTKAAEVLFNIPAHKIKVMKMVTN